MKQRLSDKSYRDCKQKYKKLFKFYSTIFIYKQTINVLYILSFECYCAELLHNSLAFLLPKAAKDCFEQREQSRTCSGYAESRKTTNEVKTKNAFCVCASCTTRKRPAG
jgi:hypothetical protein